MDAEAQIRLARAEELRRVIEIEDRAGVRYADAGLPPDLEGLAEEVVAQAIAERLLWVMAEGEQAVGFALCWRRPDALHLRELNVLPAWMGRGLGRRLVEHVCAEARAMGLGRVTLTTFRDVAWNAPMYRRWGFVEIERAALPPWLEAICSEEEGGDLRHWPRIAMARPVAAA